MRVAPGIMVQGQVRAVHLKLFHLVRFISNRRSSEVQFAVIDVAVTSGTACLRDQVCQHVLFRHMALTIIASWEMSLKSPRVY